jgi:hypothetical protein
MFLFLIFFLKEILCTLKMNIPHNRDKCFIEKFLKKSTIFVKYDVSGYDKNLDDDELLLILNGITIFIKSDNNQNVYIKYLNETKGKIAFDIRKEGEYRICVRFYSKTIATKLSDNVVIGLKIKKGYGKFRISSNLKKTDVIQFDKSIRNSGNNIIELQKEIEEMIKEENKLIQEIQVSGDLYFILNLIQIIITIFIGIGHSIYFISFIKRQYFI